MRFTRRESRAPPAGSASPTSWPRRASHISPAGPRDRRAPPRARGVLCRGDPTGSLDPAATKAVEDILRAIARSGVKIVMATHDLGQARRLAGQLVFMLRGRVREQSGAERFFPAPAPPEAAAFIRGDLVI